MGAEYFKTMLKKWSARGHQGVTMGSARGDQGSARGQPGFTRGSARGHQEVNRQRGVIGIFSSDRLFILL